MSEESTITLYRIDKCAFFKHASDEVLFGSISEFMSDLTTWVSGLPLMDTCPFGDEGHSENAVYCFDVRSASQTFLLTTWNRVPSSDGGIATVSGDQPVGQAQVSLTSIPANAIPGYATYFWFIPDRNIVATVRFNHIKTGLHGMTRFMREFIGKFSRFVVVNPDNHGEHEIIGYRADPNARPSKAFPKFKIALLKKPGAIEYIRRSRPEIKKLIRKNFLSGSKQRDKGILEKILIGLGLTSPSVDRTPYKVKYEINFCPDEAQLNEILDSWQQAHDAKWDDIGFKFSGEQAPYWISNAIARDKFSLEVTRTNEELVALDSMLTALTNKKDEILRIAE